eukprot:scaffold66576_cov19-Tisochrysis_lutea.AAC.2
MQPCSQISSVLVNAYGSQILERKRAENVKALEAERLEFEARAELTGVLARCGRNWQSANLPVSLSNAGFYGLYYLSIV